MRRSEQIATYALVFFGLAIALVIFMLAGCGTLTLRPVQRNHALRMAEVTQRLDVTPETLNSVLANTQAECDALDNKVTGLNAGAIGVGILAGGGGVATIFTNDTPRIAVAATGVSLSVISAVLVYVNSTFAQRYARKCTVNTGGSGQ